MATVTDVEVNDYGEVAGGGALSSNLGQFQVPNNTSVIIKGEVLAVRPSDGVSKAWTFESLLKKGVGAVSVALTIPSPPNVFGTAGDLVTFASVTIAVFADSTYLGVTCTGIAGAVIIFSVRLRGRMITQ